MHVGDVTVTGLILSAFFETVAEILVSIYRLPWRWYAVMGVFVAIAIGLSAALGGFQ